MKNSKNKYEQNNTKGENVMTKPNYEISFKYEKEDEDNGEMYDYCQSILCCVDEDIVRDLKKECEVLKSPTIKVRHVRSQGVIGHAIKPQIDYIEKPNPSHMHYLTDPEEVVFSDLLIHTLFLSGVDTSDWENLEFVSIEKLD